MRRIKNIAYADKGNYVVNETSAEENALEQNSVNYKLFRNDEIGEFVSLRTAKSCPFACAFCGFPKRAGKYVYLNVDHVEEELNAIKNIGSVTTITFLDDSFNVPAKRFKEILRMMIKNKYGFKWNSFYRSDHGDNETIELMGKAGCEGVFLGVESGSDTMLKRMNKTARRNDYLKAIPLFKEKGIVTHVSLVIGFPGETNETIEETMSLLNETKPDFFRAQLWYCDPITPVMKKRDEYGITGSAFNWSHNTMDSQIASDFVDEIFLSVDDSIWLPQYGFELWSIFYLQRRGMTLKQIKDFIKCFNAVIKGKLLTARKGDIDDKLINNLKNISRFDDNTKPLDMTPVNALSGSQYVEAEKYWKAEYHDFRIERAFVDSIFEKTEQKNGQWSSVVCEINKEVLGNINASTDVDLSDILLAVYSVLLARLSGCEEILMIFSVNGKNKERDSIPVRLRPLWRISFMEFAAQVRKKVNEAMKYKKVAFRTLTKFAFKSDTESNNSIFNIEYVFSNQKKDDLENSDHLYSYIRDGIKLRLEVVELEGVENVCFSYKNACLRENTVESLGIYFNSILEMIAEKPKITIGDIAFDKRDTNNNIPVENNADAKELFNF